MDWTVCHFFTGEVYCEGSYEDCKEFLEECGNTYTVMFTDHDYKSINVNVAVIEWKPFVAQSNN